MRRKKCPHVETVMKQTCSGERAVCDDEEVDKSSAFNLEKVIGPCKGAFKRW